MRISFLHMFVKDKVEQKPREELSNEELIEEAQWLCGLYEEFLKELRRRGAGNAERAKLQKMSPEVFWGQVAIAKEELGLLYKSTGMGPAHIKIVVEQAGDYNVSSHVEI
nr:MAG TPA: hypothetical protein [Caudoviricetes sp.]